MKTKKYFKMELSEEEAKAIEVARARFARCLMMKQAEKDDMFNSGIFNDIAIGYGKIALEIMGQNSNFLREFEDAMKQAFDFNDAAKARKIYYRIEPYEG